MTAAAGTRARLPRWLKWLLSASAVLAALAAAGLWAATRYFDRERIVGLVAVEVKKATGRDIHIDGEIGFHLLPHLALRLEGVRFSNAAWGTRPELLKAGRIELSLAIRPLLDRRLEVDSVLLQGIDVLLETDAQGAGNWVLQGEPKAPAPEPAPGDAAGKPFTVDLDRLDIRDSVLAYRDGRSGKVETLKLDKLTLADTGADDALELKASFREQAIALKGSTGKVAAVLAGGTSFPFDLVATLDGARLSAKGGFGTGAESGKAQLELGAGIESVTALARLAGIDPAPLQASMKPVLPLQLSATLRQDGARTVLPDFKLVLAGQAFSGSMTFDSAGKRPALQASVKTGSLDLARWLPAAPAPAAPAKSKAPAQPKPPADARLFSAAALPWPALPALDARLDLAADDIRLPGRPALTAVQAKIVLADGRIDVQPFALRIGAGTVQGSASLRLPAGGTPTVALQAQAERVTLEQVFALAGHAGGVSGGPAEMRLDLTASGNSPQQLARSLNGELRLQVGTTRLQGDLGGFGGDVLTRLIEAVNPFHKRDKGSQLNCAAVRLPVQRGQIAVDRSVAMESDKLDVVASGRIDLAAETLELAVRPHIKEGLGVGAASLAQLVKVSGPIASPGIGIDMKGAAREAASIGVAVATGGLSLLGERMVKEAVDPHPCATALNGAAATAGKDATKPSAKAAEKPADKSPVRNPLRALGLR